MEINISNQAVEKIKRLSSEYRLEPTVRIYVEKAGCNGAVYGIAFDTPKQFDVMTEIDGIEILTDTEHITKYTDGVSIDYVTEEKEGFVIKSEKPPVRINGIGDGENWEDTSDESVEQTRCGGGCGGCGNGGKSCCGEKNKGNA